MSVDTTLPKLKRVRMPSTAASEAKPEKKATKATAKSKPVPAKKEVKTAKSSTKVETAEKKGAKPAAKADKAPAKASKSSAISADSIAAAICKLVSSGKIETIKPDYANGKTVADALTAKAATILSKTYSDKAVAAVSHADAEIAKAVKDLVAKNAANLRVNAVLKHAKKMAPAILKAAKAADAGKLSATDFRAIAFAI